ncbi:MAG: hypothetical protein ACKVQQ_15710 [Burkholderiales bacterium]
MSEAARVAIANAIFEIPQAWVAELSSDFDLPARRFEDAAELVAYLADRLARRRGAVALAVTYPDMLGHAESQLIQLTPGSVPGHSFRYTWEGWGLIIVHLSSGDDPNDPCRVSANSLSRALRWEATKPGMAPVASWDWKCAARHERRLKRVLDKVIRKG